MNRRLILFCMVNGSLFAVACDTTTPLTAPSNTPATQNTGSPLLPRVIPKGYNAERRAFGTNGAARIAIRGDINWNFFAGDQPIGIGSITMPTIDVPGIIIPNSATLRVQGL